MSVTLKTLLEDFVKEYAGSIGGRVGTCTSGGSTTTLIDSARFLAPVSAAEWARGSPVRMTGAGARAGQTGFVSSYDPTTGTITLSGAMANASQTNDTFVIVQKHIADSIDRLIEALNRGLRRDATRWAKVPATYVPNGDYMATTAQSVFLDSDGFQEGAVYLDLAQPSAWYERVVQLTGNDPNAYARSQRMPATPGDVWNLATAMYVSTAGMTCSLTVWDESNNLAIPLTFSSGSASTSSTSPVDTRATFTIPAACYSISIRPKAGFSGVAQVGLFGPMIAAPRNATMYATQAQTDIIPKTIGNFYRQIAPAPGGAPGGAAYQEVALACDVEDLRWGMALRFRQIPPFPLYYDLLLSYPALALDTDTTACPEDLALAVMAVEFFKWADLTERRSNQNVFIRTHRISLSRWEQDLERAKDALHVIMKAYGSEVKVIKRRQYGGVASA